MKVCPRSAIIQRPGTGKFTNVRIYSSYWHILEHVYSENGFPITKKARLCFTVHGFSETDRYTVH